MKGSKPGYRTGFDIDESDLLELEKFHDVIVASAIFGTSKLRTFYNFLFVLPFFFAFAHDHTFARKL